MNLLRAEAGRLLSRRFVQLMLLLLIGTFCITILVVLGKSKQPTEEMWVSARQYAAEVQEFGQLLHGIEVVAVRDLVDCAVDEK